MIIELTHKEPFPFANHYENLSKQRYFKKYFVKLLGIPEVQFRDRLRQKLREMEAQERERAR